MGMGGMGGGYTNVDPESRRVVPEANGRVVVKVVYTVLESQYQAALTAAVKNINATNKDVCYEIVGYLLEELRDVNNFENFKKDVATTNIFIGSLIFIEELADKVTTCPCSPVYQQLLWMCLELFFFCYIILFFFVFNCSFLLSF